MNHELIANIISLVFGLIAGIGFVWFFVTKISTAPSSSMLEQCYLSHRCEEDAPPQKPS